MKASRSFSTALLLSTSMMAFASASVRADEVATADNENGGQASALLEEIMVYGTKRSSAQRAQDVPMQIAAFGEGQLAARQVVTVEDLSFATPNVSLDGVGTGVGVQNFSIRGIGINSSIPSVDPTVGVFVDGVYVGVTYGVVLDTFDLESVEILKGPQGLLFGRNVTGGAVLLRSRRPDGEFRVRGKVGLETGPQWTGAMSVEGSLVEGKVAAKLSVYYKDDAGSIENTYLGRDVGREETTVLRPTITFTPTETFSTTVILEHGSTEGDGGIPQFADGHTAGNPNTKVVSVTDEPGDTDLAWSQLTVESNLDVMGGRITNIFGYRNLDQTSFGDIDGSSLHLFHADFMTAQTQYSDELRYSGNVTDKWTLTAGGYYFTQDILYRERRSLVFGSTKVAGGGNQDHEVWGAFLSNDYAVNDEITVTAGIRYTKETKDANVDALGYCDYDTRVCPETKFPKGTWDDWTPKLGVQWHVKPDMQVYAQWSRGFRSGGFNFRANPAIFSPGPTAAETQNAYEIGFKSSLMDKRVRLNGAIFQNDIKDMQRELNTSDPVQGVVQGIVNTADARIRGLEIDMNTLVTDQLAINMAVGYLSGKYKTLLFDISGDGVIDDTDYNLRIPRLADWTVNIGATYDMPMGDLGTLTARADYSYRSPTVFTDNNSGYLAPHNMVNAGLTFTPTEGNWTLAVYGKNLTDEAVLGGVTELPFGAFGAPYYATLKKGRRFGAEVRFEF